MRAPAVSFAKLYIAALMAVLLAFILLPASALAEGEGAVSTSTEGVQETDAGQAEETTGANASESTEPDAAVSAPLASVLAGAPTAFVNADVALDGEPVVGSFTLDGLTYAVTEGSNVQLVGVSPDWQQATGLQAEEGSSQLATLASGVDGSDADSSALLLPGTVVYNDVEYIVTSIGAYAFYLSGVTSVELPASVVDVDDRTFRSSDVASVEVAEGNPTYSSFDGALYDVDQSSLLLIPEGKQGTVLLPLTAESAAPSVFSHCSLVTQVSVEEGSAAFASENGLLYTSDFTTLLRVPAGAIDITIREGCTTIAAGALEACASLATISAPDSVTSISPDVFTSVPTVSLPALAATDDIDDVAQANGSEIAGSESVQLTAMVALSSIDDSLPDIDLSAVVVNSPSKPTVDAWRSIGLVHRNEIHVESSSVSYAAFKSEADAYPNMKNKFSLQIIGEGYWTGDHHIVGKEVYNVTNMEPYVISLYSDGSYATDCSCHGHGAGRVNAAEGYAFKGWNADGGTTAAYATHTTKTTDDRVTVVRYAVCSPNPYTVRFDANAEGIAPPEAIDAIYDKTVMLPEMNRPGFLFCGWDTQKDGFGTRYEPGAVKNITSEEGASVILYAQWERVDYDIAFEVDSEPGDEDYPGVEKPDVTVNIENGPTVIEDPKRPGYVFQGWTIPNVSNTEAIDQNLVYQDEVDGKWYIDASKLPEYYDQIKDNEGKIELTARWTSIISVDVPSTVTFYADVVTQGNESREGAASSAFGQNKVASQSQVDLRIVGLESEQVQGNGSTTLGASDVLKKAEGATPSSSAQKIFSLYPASKTFTPDDLRNPDAVTASKPDDAVDFALDDILLERSFAADKFTISAGETLNLGYRLNLSETGMKLDYDKLSTLDEGQSVSIANISYCFASHGHLPSATGSSEDSFYIEYGEAIYGPEDIKASAQCISEYGENSPCYDLYSSFMESGMYPSDDSAAHGYVKWGDGGTYSIRIIGINYDDAVDDSGNSIGRAGLTFEFVSALKDLYPAMSTNKNVEGWGGSALRSAMNAGTIWNQVPSQLKEQLVMVRKCYQGGGTSYTKSSVSNDRLFLVGYAEVMATADPAWSQWWQSLVKERGDAGGPYQFYGLFAASSHAPLDPLLKKSNDTWWYRTAYPGNSTSFVLGTTRALAGYDTSGVGSIFSRSVAPAFCL